MLFPTLEFAVFFACVLPIAWLVSRWRPVWKLVILVASYVFYAAADPRFCFLLAGSTLVNQWAAVTISRWRGKPRAKRVLVFAMAINLGLLATFKYLDFFITDVSDLLDHLGVHTNPHLLHLALPVGISFFTFQGMSYVIDVWREDLRPAGWFDFAVYQAFFPHLIAGPIVRAHDLLPQLAVRRNPRAVPVTRAVGLILGGLAKKIVVADVISTRLVDPVFGAPGAHSGPEVLLAVYGYAVQIYCDFSGYTDMAIGLALLLGIRFPANFDRPYTASSLQDFWRRWHITLSTWLRDYLYIPLGGNRGGRLVSARNVMITMILGGLWHGAAWTFMAWGALHGIGLVVERQIRSRFTWRLTRTGAAIGRVVTFHFVCIAWVLFRAPTMSVAREVFGRILSWQPTLAGSQQVITPLVVLLVVAGVAVQYVGVTARRRMLTSFAGLPVALQGVLTGIALVVVVTVVDHQGVAPFIYFRF